MALTGCRSIALYFSSYLKTFWWFAVHYLNYIRFQYKDVMRKKGNPYSILKWGLQRKQQLHVHISYEPSLLNEVAHWAVHVKLWNAREALLTNDRNVSYNSCTNLSIPVRKYSELFLSPWRRRWLGNTLKSYDKLFYVMDKTLSRELFCSRTGLVYIVICNTVWPIFRSLSYIQTLKIYTRVAF